MATFEASTPRTGGLVHWLNGLGHRAALNTFMVIVLAHWAEHLTQAFQIWVLGWTRPESRGVFGQLFPWLISSEWLHYGYALIMIIGLLALRQGFTGRSRAWWTVALVVQFWHHIEHLLLFVQAQSGMTFFGRAVPTSIVQLVWSRVELHLFYNTVVFLPMVIALYLHLRPTPSERARARCRCARHPVGVGS